MAGVNDNLKIDPTRKSRVSEMIGPPEPPDLTNPLDQQELPPPPTTTIRRSMKWFKIATNEVLEDNQPLWGKPQQYFRGSATGETCVRALTFTAMGHNVPFPAKVKKIFRTGNAVEAANMETMREVPDLVIEPPKSWHNQWEAVYEDPPVVGHLDVLTKRPEDGVTLVGEIKSINEWGFKKLPPETDNPVANFQALLKAKWGYIHQWNTYAGAPNIDCKEGFMLFEQKNASEQLIYSLLRDEEILAATLSRLRLATPYIKSEPMMLAPIPDNRNPRDSRDKACIKCPKRYLCIRLPDEGTTYDEVRRVDSEVRG